MIKTLMLGLFVTATTLILLAPFLVPVYVALLTGDNAYYFLSVPGLLGFAYLNGKALKNELLAEADKQDR